MSQSPTLIFFRQNGNVSPLIKNFRLREVSWLSKKCFNLVKWTV